MGNEVSLPAKLATAVGGGDGRGAGDSSQNGHENTSNLTSTGVQPPRSRRHHTSQFRDIYRLDRKIGEGSHSQVFMAMERGTGRKVAVKAIHTDWLDRRRLEFLRAEIEIHQQVSVHPCIVRLLGVYDDPEACYIVEELAEGGSLLAHLHTRSTIGTEDEARRLLRRLLMAAQFLHELGIVHRDVKPENLLIMSGEGMGTTKLADFGFALRLPTDGSDEHGQDASARMTPRGLPACGTPEYIAPEVLLQQPFNGKADVWSAGVTAFCLLTGVMPFNGLTLDNLYTSIMDGACSFTGPEWARVSKQALDFVQRMLEVNPRDRWSAGELLQHPWMVMAKGDGISRDGTGGVRGMRRPRVRLKALVYVVLFANRLMRLAEVRTMSDAETLKLGNAVLSERVKLQEHELGSP